MIKGSTQAKKPDGPHKFFNLQKIIEATQIQPDKVYNNFKGVYSSLTNEERKQIATALMMPVQKIFEGLGMVVSFSKLPENGNG